MIDRKMAVEKTAIALFATDYPGHADLWNTESEHRKIEYRSNASWLLSMVTGIFTDEMRGQHFPVPATGPNPDHLYDCSLCGEGVAYPCTTAVRLTQIDETLGRVDTVEGVLEMAHEKL